MSLRSTLIGLFLIIALSAGGLFAVKSIFGRDSQMRDAERSFYTDHKDEFAAVAAARRASEAETEWDEDESEGDLVGDTPTSLDDWYAEAGGSDKPASAEPEDKSHLINDAEPYSDAEPFDTDTAEL